MQRRRTEERQLTAMEGPRRCEEPSRKGGAGRSAAEASDSTHHTCQCFFLLLLFRLRLRLHVLTKLFKLMTLGVAFMYR